MNTRAINSAAGVILAALEQDRTPAGIALALEAAGLLMSPEAALDLASVSTDAVALLDQAVVELKREHEESARLRSELESARVDGLRLMRAEQRRAELEAVLSTHRKDDQAKIERLRAQVAELRAERHSTNEALDDAVQELRARQGTAPGHIGRGKAARFCLACRCLEAAQMDNPMAKPIVVCPGDDRPQHRAPGACRECGQLPKEWCQGCAKCACVDRHDDGCLEDVSPQVQKLRALLAGQREALEGEHYQHLHHEYRTPHDLPPIGGVQ